MQHAVICSYHIYLPYPIIRHLETNRNMNQNIINMSRPSGQITSTVQHHKMKRVQLVGNSPLNGVDVDRLYHNVESTKSADLSIRD